MKASLTLKAGAATLTVLAMSFLATSVITYRAVSSEMESLVSEKVLPSLDRGTEGFQNLLGELLSDQQAMAREQSQEWFDLNGTNAARALATRLLPLVENYDFEGVEGVIAEIVAGDPLVLGARARSGEDVFEAGEFSETARTFDLEAESDYAAVAVDLALATQLLDDAYARMEEQSKAADTRAEQARAELSTTIETEAYQAPGVSDLGNPGNVLTASKAVPADL